MPELLDIVERYEPHHRIRLKVKPGLTGPMQVYGRGNLSFEEAAVVPISATTALQALRDVGQVQPGQRVLVIGASGGVGSAAVQLARRRA